MKDIAVFNINNNFPFLKISSKFLHSEIIIYNQVKKKFSENALFWIFIAKIKLLVRETTSKNDCINE